MTFIARCKAAWRAFNGEPVRSVNNTFVINGQSDLLCAAMAARQAGRDAVRRMAQR